MELHADPAEEVSKLEPEWLQIILHFAAQKLLFCFSIYSNVFFNFDLFAFRAAK